MTIVIACDEKYYNKAVEYGLFNSLKKNWKDKVCVLCIGFLPHNSLYDGFLYAFCGHVGIESYRKDWPSNREGFVCAEGEDFTKWFNIPDDELVIHLDADMVMQREMSSYEKLMLQEIEEGEIGMSGSAMPLVSLREEFHKLKPKRGYEKVNQDFVGKLGYKHIYCSGLIVAKMKTYREISKIYNESFDNLINSFDHHAAGQWLFSYIAQTHFKVFNLGFTIHNALWFMDTEAEESQSEEQLDQLKCKGEVVLFNHTKFNKKYEY